MYIMDLENEFNKLLNKHIYVLTESTKKNLINRFKKAKTIKTKQKILNILIDFDLNQVASTYDLNNLKRINKEREKIKQQREYEQNVQNNKLEMQKLKKKEQLKLKDEQKNVIQSLINEMINKVPNLSIQKKKDEQKNVIQKKNDEYKNSKKYKDKRLKIYDFVLDEIKDYEIFKEALEFYESEKKQQANEDINDMDKFEIADYILENNYNTKKLKKLYNEFVSNYDY